MTTEKTSIKGIIIWLVCVLFYLYEFLLRTILGTFQTPIMQDLHLDSLRFALLSSTAYLLIYGMMQIPVGAIVSRFGLKKAMFLAALICALANIGFVVTESYTGALVARVLMGLGSSFGFICLLVAVYDWMPRRNIALFIGLSQFFGTMGPMLAGGPLNALSDAAIVTWRGAFSILSIIGFVVSGLIFLIVDKNRQSQGETYVLSKSTDIIQSFRLVIIQRQVWLIAIFCAFVYFSLEYLSENEGKKFLMLKGFSSGFSSYMITLAWLGFAIGSPICGYISDKISRRKPILLFSALATLVSLSSIIYLPLPAIITSFCFILLGVGVGASSVGIVIMGEQFKSTNLAAGLGLNNAITMLFISILAPLLGILLTAIATHSNYSLTDYRLVFLLLVSLPLMALLIVFFGIRETFGKSAIENIVLKVDRTRYS
jgi:MFS family permease